jgi:WD40 repeat protein
VGSQDGSVTLWNLQAPSEPVATFAVEPVRVDAIAFSHDGRTLACGTRLGQITLWDLAQNARRANLNSYRQLTGAGVDITGIGFAGSGGAALLR